MGISSVQMELLQDSLWLTKVKFRGLRMLEFGNQLTFRFGDRRRQVPAKLVFQWLGTNHISIDINGRDGALQLDLGHPLPAKFVDFDVVTNFGCTEHIKGHYHAWKNMHEACRIDGLMIHALPEEGSWLGHGRVLYQEDRVSNLAHACGYHTVILRRHEWQKRGHSENLIHCCFQRMSTPFVSEEVFEDLMHGKGEQ